MAEPKIIENASDNDIADWLSGRIARALDSTQGRVRIALPGGSTPFPILSILVGRDHDWGRITVVPTDDRDVPEDHAASNTGKLRALFEPVGARVEALSNDATDDATISDRFALVWLGMGGDGHIASLFPNTDPQIDDPKPLRRITPDPLPPEAPFDRLTLTLPTLLDTDEIVLVIRGEDKREVFDAALRREHDLPIARLLRGNAKGAARPVTCFT